MNSHSMLLRQACTKAGKHTGQHLVGPDCWKRLLTCNEKVGGGDEGRNAPWAACRRSLGRVRAGSHSDKACTRGGGLRTL